MNGDRLAKSRQKRRIFPWPGLVVSACVGTRRNELGIAAGTSPRASRAGKILTESAGDTEQQNRATFEHEAGAIWTRGHGRHGAARTGGAARHAGQDAESRWAGSSGLTRAAAALLAGRFENGEPRVKRTGPPPKRCVGDGLSLARMD